MFVSGFPCLTAEHLSTFIVKLLINFNLGIRLSIGYPSMGNDRMGSAMLSCDATHCSSTEAQTPILESAKAASVKGGAS